MAMERTKSSEGGIVKVYRVGIIGFGFIGKVHAYGYASLPFFYDPPPLAAKITHVVTSRMDTAEKARATLGARWPRPTSAR